MKVLIVHAHHEARSFSSALCVQAKNTLLELGHQVVVSDLYAQAFDPVSDRRNFTSCADANFLKQQAEEAYASQQNGFSAELEAEIAKLEACDLLVFNFPLWWFGMPAILKGWVDRVFAAGRIYGGPKLYEGGLGGARKKAMVMLTTGGGPEGYSGYGVNPSLEQILKPIEHGIFWFNGFLPLAPFVAWSPARSGQEQRQADLLRLDSRLRSLDQELPRQLPLKSDFGPSGQDEKKRYMVLLSRTRPMDEQYRQLIPAEMARVAELQRQGVLLQSSLGAPGSDPWRAFLLFRESSPQEVLEHLRSLPLAAYLDFEITELMKVPAPPT